jgi:hypothetical protein
VNHDTPVPEEGADALLEGSEVVGVGNVDVAGDISVLSRQITNLAGLRSIGVAWGRLSTLVRVKVSQCRSTVSTLRNGLVVKVVDCHLSAEFEDLDSVSDLLKGPPSLGRPDNLTLKITPVPSGLDRAYTSPLMLPPLG